MVGLSILLDAQNSSSSCNSVHNNKNPQLVINKITNIKASLLSPSSSSAATSFHSKTSSSSTNFLDACFLCHQRLLPGKDIYMYRGDRAFCSTECRNRQIIMDDEENIRKETYSSSSSLASMKKKPSFTSSSAYHRQQQQRKGNNNRTAGHGGFVY